MARGYLNKPTLVIEGTIVFVVVVSVELIVSGVFTILVITPPTLIGDDDGASDR